MTRAPGPRRLRTNSAAAVASPANSTISSKATGTKAGSESKGLPPTLSGQSVAEVQYWNHRATPRPVRPASNVTRGRRERPRPARASKPSSGCGE